MKFVETGQYFYTLDTEEGQEMQHLCREYTMLRNEKGTRKRGWILRNTRIGTVLDMQVYHEDQYTNEVPVKSLFQDRTASWVRIVNGVDKVRDRIDANQGRRGHSFGETHSLIETKAKASSDADSRLHSCS